MFVLVFLLCRSYYFKQRETRDCIFVCLWQIAEVAVVNKLKIMLNSLVSRRDFLSIDHLRPYFPWKGGFHEVCALNNHPVSTSVTTIW